jgi:hypothetical protein
LTNLIGLYFLTAGLITHSFCLLVGLLYPPEVGRSYHQTSHCTNETIHHPSHSTAIIIIFIIANMTELRLMIVLSLLLLINTSQVQCFTIKQAQTARLATTTTSTKTNVPSNTLKTTTISASASASALHSSITNNDFFGESRDSFMLKEFSTYEDLTTIVKLSSMPLPERPDGIVTVAKYSSANRQNCIATEDQYERLARSNPATLFLRCFEEYKNANLLIGQAQISTFPTYDIYYAGNRVARIDGNVLEVERVLNMYQLQNSDLDLFSEAADNEKRVAFGEGKSSSSSSSSGTPKTTARFIPGYDWNTDGGAFDEAAKKAEDSFEDTYGNWLPNMDDD